MLKAIVSFLVAVAARFLEALYDKQVEEQLRRAKIEAELNALVLESEASREAITAAPDLHAAADRLRQFAADSDT
ncbi:hypothetical protein ACXHXM_34070